jgi:hypothetical protein
MSQSCPASVCHLARSSWARSISGPGSGSCGPFGSDAGQQLLELFVVEAQVRQIRALLLQLAQQRGELVLLPLAELVVVPQRPLFRELLRDVTQDGGDVRPAELLGRPQAHVAREHRAVERRQDRALPEEVRIDLEGVAELLEARVFNETRVPGRGVELGEWDARGGDRFRWHWPSSGFGGQLKRTLTLLGSASSFGWLLVELYEGLHSRRLALRTSAR